MDISAINKQHADARKIQNKILKWDDKENPLAEIEPNLIDVIRELEVLTTTHLSKKVNSFISM